MLKQENKLLLVFAGLGVGAGAGYWLYLYMQDPESAPTFSEVFSTLKSYFTRASAIVTTTAKDAVGQATYMDLAKALVAKQESFSAKAYSDVGKLAIGYGHDIRPGDPYDKNSVIDEAEGSVLLEQDLVSSDTCIGESVTAVLTDSQRAALISFVYNIGCGAFKSSTMLKKLNANDFEGASLEFGRWIYDTNPQTGQKEENADLRDVRRPAEQALFDA